MRRISQLFCHGVIALVAWSSALTYADAAVSHGGVLTDYEASYNEGLAKYERGDYPGAIADFQDAARLGDSEAKAWLAKTGYQW